MDKQTFQSTDKQCVFRPIPQTQEVVKPNIILGERIHFDVFLNNSEIKHMYSKFVIQFTNTLNSLPRDQMVEYLIKVLQDTALVSVICSVDFINIIDKKTTQENIKNAYSKVLGKRKREEIEEILSDILKKD